MKVIKHAVLILCFAPITLLLWKAFHDELSANPISDITQETGIWTLRFLLFTLALTPLRKITGLTFFAGWRRMIGLVAFFYVCLHFTTYIWLDKFFDTNEMLLDIVKRPFITVGFSSFLLLIPLAATSTKRIMKAMGGKRWKKLHTLVYLTAVGGVIHYLWLVKADRQRPLIYGGILSILLGYRVAAWARVKLRSPQKDHPSG